MRRSNGGRRFQGTGGKRSEKSTLQTERAGEGGRLLYRVTVLFFVLLAIRPVGDYKSAD